jgi:predicted ArsR family transcriptional regulator
MPTSEGFCDDDRADRQRQARALGDPTRFAIFCEILDSPAPVRVDVLTEHFGLNHNAIRQHLAKLVEAGLVEGTVMPRQGPGRPALHYRPRPEALAAWSSESPYQQLALMLLDVARGTATPFEAGAAAGRAIAAGEGDEPLARLNEEMARRGFRPRVTSGDDGVVFVMQRCPYEAAAAADPDIVCTIHRGLAAGMLEALGGTYQVDDLISYAPDGAGCRLEVRPAAD